MEKEFSWCEANNFLGVSNYMIAEDWMSYSNQHYLYAYLNWGGMENIEDRIMTFYKIFLQKNWTVFAAYLELIENFSVAFGNKGFFSYDLISIQKNDPEILKSFVDECTSWISKIKALNHKDNNSVQEKIINDTLYQLEHWRLKLDVAYHYIEKHNEYKKIYENYKDFILDPKQAGRVNQRLVMYKLENPKPPIGIRINE
jgi:hypothetical protein